MDMGLAILTCGDLDVTLWLHTGEDPPAAEWSAALERISTLKRQRRGDLTKMRALAVSDGGAPNVTQRAQLFSDLYEGKSKSAVITPVLSNRFKRGVATAISWINPSFRAFSPEEYRLAVKHLDLDGHWPTLLKELQRLQSQKDMPHVKALELILAQPQTET